MSTKLSPREARKKKNEEFNRTQILDAAEELFANRGYHETGLKDVVEYCEFSMGTIYTLFSSKEKLYQAVLNRHTDANMAGLIKTLQQNGRPIDVLVDMAMFQIGFYRTHPAWGRLITRTMSPGLIPAEARSPVMESTGTRYRQILVMQTDLIKRGQDAGEIRQGDPAALALFYTNLITSYNMLTFGESDLGMSFDVDELVVPIRRLLEVA